MSRPGFNASSYLVKATREYQEACVAYAEAVLDDADDRAVADARAKCVTARTIYQDASATWQRSLSKGSW